LQRQEYLNTDNAFEYPDGVQVEVFVVTRVYEPF